MEKPTTMTPTTARRQRLASSERVRGTANVSQETGSRRSYGGIVRNRAIISSRPAARIGESHPRSRFRSLRSLDLRKTDREQGSVAGDGRPI